MGRRCQNASLPLSHHCWQTNETYGPLNSIKPSIKCSVVLLYVINRFILSSWTNRAPYPPVYRQHHGVCDPGDPRQRWCTEFHYSIQFVTNACTRFQLHQFTMKLATVSRTNLKLVYCTSWYQWTFYATVSIRIFNGVFSICSYLTAADDRKLGYNFEMELFLKYCSELWIVCMCVWFHCL